MPNATEIDRPFTFVCSPDNDIYVVYGQCTGTPAPRFEGAAGAIEEAPPGTAVLILADGYPGRTTAIEDEWLARARAKRLRLLVEFPTRLPGYSVGEPKATRWERAVVTSGAFGPSLPAMRILAVHDCRYVPIKAGTSDLAIARVAGNDVAVYGIPDDAQPLLFEAAEGLLVATTKLSHFVTGRYGPTADWALVWESLLRRLAPEAHVPKLTWTPTVRPSYGPHDSLADDAERLALLRGADWLIRSNLLIDATVAASLTPDNTGALVSWPSLPAGATRGDGSHGLFECLTSQIKVDGTQWVSPFRRGDCTGETAMALAFAARLGTDPQKQKIAENLLDFWYFQSGARKGEYADPTNGNFGLIGWGLDSPTWEHVVWGDDNARLLLGTLAVAAATGEDRWDEAVLMALLANLRTTGIKGFRGDATVSKDLEAGWRAAFERDIVNIGPHYECYPWACFLWAFQKTGYRPFFERAASAIRITTEAYPSGWRWTNGLQQERARMLLPLAWLVRVEDTVENRSRLARVARDLLDCQDACGAIREELGEPGKGVCEPPRTNAEYGVNECPLIQSNGEPISDLLYTTNFALLGLHEAAAATGESLYRDAEDRLARFLCRIQVRSEVHSELDGAWYRGFDFGRWDYWGSNSDNSWGVWCTETGWTQSWIVSVLALREMGASLWDTIDGSDIGKHLATLLPIMIPAG